MIIISSPTPQVGEIETIHSLFENGLELLHVRKPEFTKLEMEVFVSAIRHEYKNQLSLHSHHQLAEAFGINRIHFTEKKRNETSENCLKDWKKRGFKLSTSIHSMSDFEKLSKSIQRYNSSYSTDREGLLIAVAEAAIKAGMNPEQVLRQSPDYLSADSGKGEALVEKTVEKADSNVQEERSRAEQQAQRDNQRDRGREL